MMKVDSKQRFEGFIFLGLFGACIPVANWLIENVGTVCLPSNGPCLLPVTPGGLMAPSGVVMVGVALVLRDLIQRRLGPAWALAAICAGAILSGAVASGPLVVASAVAFLLSEIADFAVYTPLQRQGLLLAVMASGGIGLVVDSVAFLLLAFGSLDFIAGQIVGKIWALLITLPAVAWLRRRDERLGFVPA